MLKRITIYFTILLFLILISLPVTQGVFGFFPEEELFGMTKEAIKPEFNFKNWLNMSFQKDFESWIDSKLGLRGYFIKTDNEINYLLFKEIHQKTHNKIIIGKDNYLFENSYIKSHIGRDYRDIPVLEERIQKLKKLQDKLSENKIAMIFLISPSKASFYPEKIPPELIYETADKNPETNYNRIMPMLEKYEINYIDGLDVLLNKKDTSEYLLFSKSGTHWTRYGSCLVLGDIIKETDRQLNSKSRVPDCSEVKIFKEPLFEDRDLADLANLWNTERFDQELAYPQLKHETDIPNKIDLLMIGDSFGWGLLKNVRESKGVTDYNFYYYFNSDYKEDGVARDINKNPKDLKEFILSKNLLIIEANEIALNDIGFGFIEAALEALANG